MFSAERVHCDDATVPVLAKSKTDTGRIWTYVRDDRPFDGGAPPAAVFYYSRDRAAAHPERHLAGYSGILQADAYSGYNRLYEEGRSPGPILEAACWAHARRKFFVLADIETSARRRASNKTPSPISPLALEAVRKIDVLFDIERAINSLDVTARKAARQERSVPVVAELEAWMRAERAAMSRHNDVAKAMNYMLKRWDAFTRFLDTFSRFSPVVDPRFSYRAEDVVGALERVCASIGYPKTIRVDLGSEFISRDLDLWAYAKGVTLDFSRPGKPTDNAFAEAFNSRVRAECMNAHWFMSLADAREKLEAWRRYYNEERPHGAIGNKPPISLLNPGDAASPSP